jgi:hypothetical protein
VRNGGRIVSCRSEEASLAEVFDRMTAPET